jgi:hypothetical protein
MLDTSRIAAAGLFDNVGVILAYQFLVPIVGCPVKDKILVVRVIQIIFKSRRDEIDF